MLPVIDPTEILKTAELINEAKNRFEQLKDISALDTKQFNFLQNNLSGNYGYGSLFNDAHSLRERQWANDNWTDVLRASSNNQTSAFAAAQKRYETLYPVRAANHITPTRNQNNLTRAYYEEDKNISRAALAASSMSYDKINEHIKNLHDILLKLEDQQSEKSAIDLNARLVAELGFIQLEMLRQQNIQTQIMATQSQNDVNGMSEEAQFLEWHNH